MYFKTIIVNLDVNFCQFKTKLFFVAVVVVYADEGACESEYLSEGDEDGMVDFSQWMCNEPTRKQCAPESAHCSSDDELKAFHLIMNYELRIKS